MNKEQLSRCCKSPMTVVNEDEGTCYYTCDKCKMPTDPYVEQYKCQSYYDDDNVLQDCTCGKCDSTTTNSDWREKAKEFWKKNLYGCIYEQSFMVFIQELIDKSVMEATAQKGLLDFKLCQEEIDKALQEQMEEFEKLIASVEKMQHKDEVHCGCLPTLKYRLAELTKGNK